jgi:Ca2+-binding RTX toxin-like protein
LTNYVGPGAAASDPFRAIVYILATFSDGSRASGSGVVVGTNDVLTAAHVIYSESAGGLATEITVYAGRDGGNLPYGAADVQAASYYQIDLDSEGLISTTESANDVAILGLTTALGDQTGVFVIDPTPTSGNFHVTGYPGVYADATGPRLTDDIGTAQPDGDSLIFFNSDLEINSGNSGGPVWYSDNGIEYVVSVVSTSGWGINLSTQKLVLDDWIAGNDYLLNPVIFDNNITGSSDDDILTGSGGNDLIRGLAGNDQLSGGSGNDVIYGNQGTDTIDGGDGQNTLFGGQQNDVLTGGNGDDVIYGNFQADFMRGTDGDDLLWGGQNNDTLQGGIGNDTLIGNRGDDALTGGTGADQFQVNWGSDQWRDTILDFTPGDGDTIRILGTAPSATLFWSYNAALNQTRLTDDTTRPFLEIDGPTRTVTQIATGMNEIILIGNFSSFFQAGFPDFVQFD